MLKIKRYYTALDRYRRSKGYGIHSPFAFRFVLKVLRERSGYYAYQTIRDGRNLALVRMVEEGISSRKVLSNKNARLIRALSRESRNKSFCGFADRFFTIP